MPTTLLRPGKIVILLSGRFAGKKALVVKVLEPTTKRPFRHALVAGIERAPRKVTKAMGKSTILRRSRVKAFVKFVNVTHLLVTRYTMTEIDVKNIPVEKVEKLSLRKGVRGQLKSSFTKSYLAAPSAKSNARFFFSKLRF